MGSTPNQDIYHFINAIKNIGAKDSDAKKTIEKIRENLKISRDSCTEIMSESYTEAFITEREETKND